MAILECANCGAKVHTEPEKYTAVCEYCGSEMTIFESTSEFEIDSKGTLVAYNGRGGDVEVPEGIITIGSYCFLDNENVYSIKLPESVKVIKSHAFRRCLELEEIELSGGLEKIEERAFHGCESLEELTLPELINNIPEGMCAECDELQKIEICGRVRHVGDSAFYNCTELRAVEFQDGLKDIGESAFEGCERLEKVSLPDSLKEIGRMAFSDCKKLVNIELPDSVKKLGAYAFKGATSLKQVKIPSRISYIEEETFRECSSLSVVDLNNVEEIGSSAFADCLSLKEIDFKKVKVIKKFAFKRCNEFEKVIAENIETLENFSFCDCSGIREVRLSDTLKDLGTGLFCDSPKLDTIYLPRNLRSCGSAFLNKGTCKNIYCYADCATLELVQNTLSPQLHVLTTISSMIKDLGMTYTRLETGALSIDWANWIGKKLRFGCEKGKHISWDIVGQDGWNVVLSAPFKLSFNTYGETRLINADKWIPEIFTLKEMEYFVSDVVGSRPNWEALMNVQVKVSIQKMIQTLTIK